MVVGMTTTYAISAYNRQRASSNPAHRDVYLDTLCNKFVSDLRQIGGFLRILRFLPPIKLTAKKILKVTLNNKTLTLEFTSTTS